jgi:large subunit ribosomal protein L4
MQVPTWKSGAKGQASVDVAFLGDKVLKRTMHAAVIMYEANSRTGTHSTLTRAFVARSKKQLFSQKGTGRARVRHPQVVQCRGGGTAKGPHPRDYSYRMPKQALRAALRAALASKFADGEAVMADNLCGAKPSTKALKALLAGLGAARTCLIVDAAPSTALILSARNIRGVTVTSAKDLNAREVLAHKTFLVTDAGLAALREVHSHA